MSDCACLEIEGTEVDDAITERFGLPRVNRELLSYWIAANVPEDRVRDAWLTAEIQWLQQLGRSMPGDYKLFQSPQSLLLAAMPRGAGRDASGLIEKTLDTIDSILPGVVKDSSQGKHLVLCLERVDDVKRYMADFGDDTCDWSGLCIGAEAPHVVMRGSVLSESILVHELTHACTSHLDMPHWLSEAMALRMEQILGAGACGALPRDCRRWWQEHDLQVFWNGEAFRGGGEKRSQSYVLAMHLLDAICLRRPKRLASFIRGASRDDGGRQAARDHLEQDLESIMEDLLKEPEPTRAEKLWRKLTRW